MAPYGNTMKTTMLTILLGVLLTACSFEYSQPIRPYRYPYYINPVPIPPPSYYNPNWYYRPYYYRPYRVPVRPYHYGPRVNPPRPRR